MQAMGLVNDPLDGCHARNAALAARAVFNVPAATIPRQSRRVFHWTRKYC